MKDYAPNTKSLEIPQCPMVLILGTSMSCGKTISGKIIIDIIKNKLGFEKIAGAKFTGGGYKHDTHAMMEAGAKSVIDFIDAGYCSTVMPSNEFRVTALPAMMGEFCIQSSD
jgi:hypothetical protein